MFKDYTWLAIGSLRKRFLRTLLTLIGIFIGIASVVALISLGQGMQAAINQQFSRVGTDKIIIQGAAAGFGPPGQNAAGTVDKEDLELIKKVPGVNKAAGRLLRSVNLEYGTSVIVTFGASLPEEQEARGLVIDANNIKTKKGRMLKPDESIMVNEDDMRELLNEKDKFSAIIVQTNEKPAEVADRILRVIRKDRRQKE